MLDEQETDQQVEQLRWEVAQLRQKLERLARAVEVLDRNLRLLYESTQNASASQS